MASHGVLKSGKNRLSSDHSRKTELQNIQKYKDLVDKVTTEIREQHFSRELLDWTSKLLTQNPEYYTIWNYRRHIMRHLFDDLRNENAVSSPTAKKSQPSKDIAELISADLNFLFPLLRKFPKCYWIWNYRLWLLEEASNLLPDDNSIKFWLQELGLVGKMLHLDSRNFHGWGYRRTVVAALESNQSRINKPLQSMTEQEFQYTTRMIEANLSNFSAWHNRSKLIPRLLNEQAANGTARQRVLESELELIQRALYADSNDQSLWFYHQYLVSTFDPKYFNGSIAPHLTLDQRLEYISREFNKVLEMLDGAEDCKWIYQSLIQVSMLHNTLSNDWPAPWDQIQSWIRELKRLDPLRMGRWHDIEETLNTC